MQRDQLAAGVGADLPALPSTAAQPAAAASTATEPTATVASTKPATT